MTPTPKPAMDLELIHTYGHACRRWMMTEEAADARAMDAARNALAERFRAARQEAREARAKALEEAAAIIDAEAGREKRQGRATKARRLLALRLEICALASKGGEGEG